MTANRLTQHYVDNARVLPWRSPPGGAPQDPYRVWLSEVMLQQTTVATVAPRFERFVARWPTVEALAAAADAEVMQEWAGLGYYARARNLLACARQVVRLGGFPRTAAELRRLPGLGEYTAAAVAAIAFGEPVPVVDTNIFRVTARLHGLAQPSRAEVVALVERMTPADRPGDFAQAMMDLGATICRPTAPRCSDCPMVTDCKAAATGAPEAFPARRPKAEKPRRHGVAYWTERNGAVWLVRRPAKGLLGGMAALPTGDWIQSMPPAGIPGVATVRHVFTHFRLELSVQLSDEPVGDGWWHPIDQLSEAGLPTLFRRAADAAIAAGRLPKAA